MSTRQAPHRHDLSAAGYWSLDFRQGVPYFLVPGRSRSDRALLSACFLLSVRLLSIRQMLQLPELLSPYPGSSFGMGVPSLISLVIERDLPVDDRSDQTP